MEKEFWLDAWKIHKIGFHKDDYNMNLLGNFDAMGLKPDAHILVPLCGKTLDMLWLLENGFKVTGVELSDIAIKEFFQENKIDFQVEEYGKYKKYTGKNITLLEGDIFDLDLNLISEVDGVYDRAATVALPESMRVDYLNKLIELSSEAKLDILMVLLEYQQDLVSGPPFSVPENFIKSHFSQFKINKLKDVTVKDVPPKFSDAGAVVAEKVYIIKA